MPGPYPANLIMQQQDLQGDEMDTNSLPTNTGERILNLEDIIQMTIRDGENWALAHARRLLHLIEQIGTGLAYDTQALTLATYLHDWGAFPRYALKDVEHALRSRQVAEADILPHMDLSPAQTETVLQAIELHDYRDPRPAPSNEALLLREADMLEFLGAIGMAREFARGPRNVDACNKRVLSRRAGIQGRLTITLAKEIARRRIDRMEQFARWLDEEGFGIL
jgi:HD superfamily phosphodiesterase